MKIYTNEQHQIIAYNTAPELYAHEYDVEASFRGHWCDTCFFGYKYEPAYETELNQDGSTKTDTFGNPIHKLDVKGEKRLLGMSFYPFVDMNTLNRIQQEHDAQEAQAEELTSSIIDNDFRLSMMELAL